MDTTNFHYGQVLLSMLYDIEIEDEEYEEIGLLAWEYIGNKNVKLYKLCAKIDPCDNNSVTLPCNAYVNGGEVEAVTTSYEDWERSTNTTNWGDVNSAFVENRNEFYKFYNGPYYLSGKFLKYEQVGDKLYFDRDYGTVNILYKGVLLDDEGLPEITNKEAMAIATYVAYYMKYKEGLKTNNAQLIQIANTLKAEWLKQCDQARVTYLNQNDMNTILDVKSSWNRHTFGKSYKPLP